MQIFELSKKFPVEERYSLTDQIRRSSRSVCANLAEAWRKRLYKAAFISKLSDSAQQKRRKHKLGLHLQQDVNTWTWNQKER
ncbi:MAG: four helix bundle protein [Stenomitos frigidus ULC029]